MSQSNKTKVVIQGQTLDTYVVDITDGSGRTERFDISSLLRYDTNRLDEELETAVAHEHFWSQLAIEAEEEADAFDRWYQRYLAHCDRYARYILTSQKERTPSGTARERVARLAWSQHATEADKQYYAKLGYAAYVEEATRTGIDPISLEDFTESMYMYDLSYEEIEQLRAAYSFHAKRLNTIAESMRHLIWSLRTMLASRRQPVV